MEHHIEELQIAGFGCRLYLPPDYDGSTKCYPTVYVNGEIPLEEILTKLVKFDARMDFILLSIKPKSWNDDFTPWQAPAFRVGEDAPQGRADTYLACLTKEIKPYMDTHYRTKSEPQHTALFGYSLGGLAAVYAIYKTDVFGAAASLSGSLWYDGFCGFMEREKPLRTDLRVYLSLGKKESRSKNPRMGKVAECTQRASEILKGQLEQFGDAGVGSDPRADGKEPRKEKGDLRTNRSNPQTDGENGESVCLVWNEGGHFHDIEGRFVKAIIWWMEGLPEAEENILQKKVLMESAVPASVTCYQNLRLS